MSTHDLSAEKFSNEFPSAIGRPANAALVNSGVTKLNQIAKMTEKELLIMHGIGPKAVRILKQELAKRDLQLKQ